MEQTWSIETAASLSQLGLILLSPEALEELYRSKELEGEDKQLYDMHPSIASDLLKKMPRMDRISEIILLQHKQFDGSGPPFNRVVSGDDLPIEARILKAVLDLDLAEVQGRDTLTALKRMRESKGWYDPLVLESLTKVTIKTEEQPVVEVDIADLTEVMVFEEDVLAVNGRLIIPKGQKVTRLLVHRLEQYENNIGPGQAAEGDYRELIPADGRIGRLQFRFRPSVAGRVDQSAIECKIVLTSGAAIGRLAG